MAQQLESVTFDEFLSNAASILHRLSRKEKVFLWNMMEPFFL